MSSRVPPAFLGVLAEASTVLLVLLPATDSDFLEPGLLATDFLEPELLVPRLALDAFERDGTGAERTTSD